MNPISRHLLILTVGTLLAIVFPPRVVEKSEQEAAPKRNFSLLITILTKTGSADISAYVEQSMKTIRHNWIASLPEAAKAGETGVVIVRLQIQRDGTLNQSPKIETSSHRDSLDGAAIAALRASAPFSHLPDDFHDPTIDLRITFLYNVPTRARNPEPAKPQPDATSPK